MKKVHLCAGSVYLKDYENCDIDGTIINLLSENGNLTTIDKYFKYPFNEKSDDRRRRDFTIDTKMNILAEWPWETGSVDEIVMINCFEHFNHVTDIPHIINEVQRVLKVGGVFIVNFPDIKKIVDLYYKTDPYECMELIYCNHKNQYSIHHFGYTPKTFKKLFSKSYKIQKKTIVKCDHPMTGMIVTKQ